MSFLKDVIPFLALHGGLCMHGGHRKKKHIRHKSCLSLKSSDRSHVFPCSFLLLFNQRARRGASTVTYDFAGARVRPRSRPRRGKQLPGRSGGRRGGGRERETGRDRERERERERERAGSPFGARSTGGVEEHAPVESPSGARTRDVNNKYKHF